MLNHALWLFPTWYLLPCPHCTFGKQPVLTDAGACLHFPSNQSSSSWSLIQMLEGALPLLYTAAPAALQWCILLRGRESKARRAQEEHVLPPPSLPHDPLLLDLAINTLGQVSVLSYAPDLRVKLELLLQLLIVIHSCLLSGCKLQEEQHKQARYKRTGI